MPTTIAPRFNQLIELYYQPLFRFAAALCGTPEAALTLTHRTFHQARERGVKPEAPAHIKQWLFTILLLEFLENRFRRGFGEEPAAFS